jgi:signal transduction histidine kinase/DNA-binding response OmpR family regulator
MNMFSEAKPESLTQAPSANRLLLVEDNIGDAKLVEIFLMESDFQDCEVVHKTTLGDAMDSLASESEFLAILLDLTLPDSRGFDTLDRIISSYPRSNVIVLTGLSDQELGLRMVKAGAQDYLVKGAFEASTLSKSLRFSIERNRVLKRLEETQQIAHIGSWEYFPEEDDFSASDEMFRILDCTPEKKITLAADLLNVDSCFYFLKQIHEEALDGDELKKDLTITLKDGGIRYLFVQCIANKSLDGSSVFQGIVQDITERKLSDGLRKAKELAEQSSRMKEQFMASISHEMRTPMNAILGMSHILLQTQLEQEQLNLVNSIRQSSDILLGVVNDILEASAIQNGKVVLENKPFELAEVLANLESVMQYKAQEKDIYLQSVCEEGVPKVVKGDKLRLNQILYNLVGNAVKFTDSGSVKIYVSKLQSQGGRVQLQFAVEDTGIGIPEDKIAAIFETFNRVRTKERIFEGTGLGLSIAKNFVELQGGKIGATSEEGKGSRFFFDLWLEVGEEQSIVKKAVPAALPLGEDATFDLLLAEDHKMNQLVARKTLERKWRNINLVIAENGQEAIDMLQYRHFDIVLMDVQMPVMDGFEATRYIRENMPPEKANIPILAMTAHVHVSKDNKFREGGMDDFVLKPFDPDELFAKIAKYVKR